MKTAKNVVIAALLSVSMLPSFAGSAPEKVMNAQMVSLGGARYKVVLSKQAQTNGLILLKDDQGEIIYTEYLKKSPEKYARNFDFSQLPDGDYTMEFVAKGQKDVKKIKVTSKLERIVAVR